MKVCLKQASCLLCCHSLDCGTEQNHLVGGCMIDWGLNDVVGG